MTLRLVWTGPNGDRRSDGPKEERARWGWPLLWPSRIANVLVSGRR
jgi:hypothetical protein